MEKFVSGICNAEIHSLLSYSILGESKKTVIDSGNSHVEVERERICIDSSHFLTRLKIINISDTFVKLYSAYPIISDKFSMGEYSSQDWQIFNGTRQLNDVPGTCILGVRDESYANCYDRLSEEGYVKKDFLREDSTLCGDMITVLCAGRNYVSFEVLSSDNILNDISISSDYKGFFKAVRIGGEINCLLRPDDCFYTDWVRISTGGNFLRLLEDYAETKKAMCSSFVKPSVKSSVYRMGTSITYDNLKEKLTFLKSVKAPFEYVQLGNGWQDYIGDWENKDDVNIINLASLINNSGYKAGIWTAPVLVDKNSELCKTQRNWLLRHADGSACVYTVDDNDYFILDVSSLECLEYVEMLYQKLCAYGFYMHTVDHLSALIMQKDVVLLDPALTLANVYSRLVKTIRNAVGEEGYLSFENSYIPPLAGVADSVQITSDINYISVKDKENAISKMINQGSMRGYMGSWWHNASSVIIDSGFTKKYSPADLRCLMVCEYMNGGAPVVADLTNNEELKLLKCIIPGVNTKTYPRDAFDDGPYINVVDVEVNNDYHTLCFFNNSSVESELVFCVDSKSCGGYVDHSSGYNVSSYFGRYKKLNVQYGDIVKLGTLAAHSCEIVKIAKSNTAQILYSDMHFSMGGELTIDSHENFVRISGNNPFNCRGTYVVALPEGKTLADGRREFTFTVNGEGPFVYEKPLK